MNPEEFETPKPKSADFSPVLDFDFLVSEEREADRTVHSVALKGERALHNLSGKERELAFSENQLLNAKHDYEIVVPFSPEAPLSGVNRELKENEYLIYSRQFELPQGFNKGRVFINFGAVDQIAKVYINGSCVGEHHGGYTPFTFEITEYINADVNTVNVVVRDLCEENQYSRGKQSSRRGGIWYSKQSGIWQSVWLESTPEEYIKSVRITPDYDNEQVALEYPGNITVEALVYDGKELIAHTTDTKIKIENFKPWSPESPFLYKIIFKYGKDVVESYFGMRKFSLGNDKNGVPRLFLNNKPYFHNGLLDQGYYPDGYLTPPSNAAMEFDIKTVKDCGFNMLRKHIKIEPMLWYHYCDVNGIIVWQDMVNGGGRYGLEVSVLPFVGINLDDTNYKTFKRTDKNARDLYYNELAPALPFGFPLTRVGVSLTAQRHIPLSRNVTIPVLLIQPRAGTTGE